VHYGGVPAVQGLSLEVRQGEAVALIGPNGAGKTTTLSTIFGLTRSSSGAIDYEGDTLIGLTPEKVVRRGLALVPEGRHIFATLTVRENLELGGTPHRDAGYVASAVDQVHERFPILADYADTPAGRLSGGEQQQLAIARALISRPRLLILDEPSLGLAPIVVDTVFDILDELRGEGVTILLVEQNAMRAIEFADRAYVLRAGRPTLAGTRDELLQMQGFEQAYLGI
jgi:branched-chain amino acid transport system ATP-binding protein